MTRLGRVAGQVVVPDDEVGAAGAELLPEVGQGFGQETGPVGRRGEGRIQHEQRDHLLGLGTGQVQRRVVMQPQVTREHHDRGFHRTEGSRAYRAACPPSRRREVFTRVLPVVSGGVAWRCVSVRACYLISTLRCPAWR
jgi:hypothetical protein